jgi:hypothetical protein
VIGTGGADPFIDTVPVSGVDDLGAALPGDALPARGLAKEFDSMAATMRLAAKTGAISDPDAFAATFGATRGSIDPAVMDSKVGCDANASATAVIHVPPWSQRDRRIFLGSVAGATAVGALIVFI